MLDQVRFFATQAVDSVVSVFGVRAGEQPNFVEAGRIGEVQLRRYGPRLAAETRVTGREEAARGEGFGRLARYIFGGNRGEARIAMTAPVAQVPQQIAMTAPVAQTRVTDGWRVQFFLPAALTAPPAPLDPQVVIVTVPGETVAVLRFAGSTGVEAVAKARAELLATLETSTWKPVGEPVAWFYDPPWTLPPLRRNEVAVAVAPR